MKIGKEIALQAKKYELCQPWFKEMMRVTQYQELARMYFKGDDWSMKNDFPSVALLRQHKGAIAPYGLLVDFVGECTDKAERIAFFGNSDASLEISDYSVCKITVRHNSILRLKVKGNAIVYVNALDFAKLDIEASASARVVVYNYSKKTSISHSNCVDVKPSKFES